MGLLKTAADLVYTIRFLKLLVTPITDTDAFKAGIIDENGKKRKDFPWSNTISVPRGVGSREQPVGQNSNNVIHV